jgi:hypothetical protein
LIGLYLWRAAAEQGLEDLAKLLSWLTGSGKSNKGLAYRTAASL